MSLLKKTRKLELKTKDFSTKPANQGLYLIKMTGPIQ